jgi:hypothetical protein
MDGWVVRRESAADKKERKERQKQKQLSPERLGFAGRHSSRLDASSVS